MIYDTIRDKSQVDGLLPMSELFKLVKGRATGYCEKRSTGKQQVSTVF